MDEYNLELMISLAVVAVTYAIADRFGLSGPIAVVAAGLMFSGRITESAMSETTRINVTLFWSLIDNVINALLFLLVGISLIAVHGFQHWPVVILAGIVLAVVVRFVSAGIPGIALNPRRLHHSRSIAMLTWGALRGGVSIALALGLPASRYRDQLLMVTYSVVVFTILVQGRSIPWLIRRLFRPEELNAL